MSINVSDAFIESYNREWRAELQGAQAISNSMVDATMAKGKTHEFKVYGRTRVGKHVGTNLINISNPSVTTPTATIEKYNDGIYVNEKDEEMLYGRELPAARESIANSLGRMSDQLKVDALDASGTPNIIAAGGAGLTEDKIFEAGQYLNRVGAPRGAMNRFFLIGAHQNFDLLKIPNVKNIDFSGERYGRSGFVTEYGGFTFLIINDDRDEGGLPLTGTTRKCFAYWRKALGCAYQHMPEIKIDRVAQNDSLLVAGYITEGDVAVQPNGIVSVACQES